MDASRSRKAQAAMEFLMTYGWAILVVLVAIGALAYFGVLSPSKFVPDTCQFGPGISCDDFKVTTTGATFIIRNGMGQDITVYGLKAVNCEDAALSTSVKQGEQSTFILTGCSNGEVSSRFTGSLTLTYAMTGTGSNLTKQMLGTISSKIQP
jgi:uncharacterized protein (UPF0333 family)